MTSLSEIKFFTTPAHECSYLPNKEATTLFVDPSITINTHMYSALSALGFRRSGRHIYRPYCELCNACIPVRIPVNSFQLKRSQKRILRRNQDLRVQSVTPLNTDQYFALYENYINQRHRDGDMYPATREQFETFLVNGRPEARFYEFWADQELVAVTVADQLKDGLSAIYTFFDPQQDKRSLGTFAVLWLIEQTRIQRLNFLYLGYWIKDCQKMSYKADYQPLETYLNNQWQRQT